MEPRIIEDAGFKVIGVSEEFDQDTTAGIPKLWQRFCPQNVPHMIGCRSFGICEPKDEASGGGQFIYTAAVEVSSIDDVPQGMVGKQIPAQKYAVFTYRIIPEDMQGGLKATLRFIWGTWLPRSDFRSANAPDFELYDDRFDATKMAGEFDIYIPVEAKE